MIPAVHNWPTNADLIADVAQLYLGGVAVMLDATYGRGGWWQKWEPPTLFTNDISDESGAEFHYDFRNLPWEDEQFDAVAYDPPYKYNGRAVLGDFDSRYGIEEYTDWKDRRALILNGFEECLRVSRGPVLVKCQDQVVSGKVRWQSFDLMKVAESLGAELVDRFDMLGGGRPQPEGRRQVHARDRGSSLLVFD